MKDQREIIIPDLDYQAEVRKCKTMEDVVIGMDIVLRLLKVVLVKLA